MTEKLTYLAGSGVWTTAAVPGVPAPRQVLPLHEGVHGDGQEAPRRFNSGQIKDSEMLML